MPGIKTVGVESNFPSTFDIPAAYLGVSIFGRHVGISKSQTRCLVILRIIISIIWKYECQLCTSWFSRRRNLRKHLETVANWIATSQKATTLLPIQWSVRKDIYNVKIGAPSIRFHVAGAHGEAEICKGRKRRSVYARNYRLLIFYNF